MSKVISTKYEVAISSGPVTDNTTSGQYTYFTFNTLAEMRLFLKNIRSSTATSTTNKLLFTKIEIIWDDSTRKISQTITSLNASQI